MRYVQTTTKLARAASFWFGAASLVWLTACSDATHQSGNADGVSVSPANEVRQGQAQISLSFSRAAGGLSKPSRVDLEDLVVAVEPSSTDQELRLTVSVPHGAKPGWRTLSIDTSSGTSTEANAIDVTAITVDPTGLDSQLGTTSSPFRTIKQALSVAGAGDTCLLHGGQYDEPGGETWSYPVPEALSIVGESTSTTTLQGPAPDAFEPSAALSLQALTFSDFDVALNTAQPAQLSLHDIAVRGGAKGIVLAGASSALTLEGSSIDASDYAVELGASCEACALTIDSSTLTESGEGALIQVSPSAQHSVLSLTNATTKGGIFVADALATMTVSGGTLQGNGDNAALNFAGTQLDAMSATFSAGSAPYGINLKAGAMTLSDVTVHGNQYAVYQLAGNSKLRNTKLDAYASIGLYFASGALDLGTATDAGDDSFSGNAPEAYGLYVDTNTSPLSCSNVSFDGVLPPAGTVQAGTDLLTQPDEYILTPGKTISFYRVP